jgi:hypothetical protein
MDPCDEPLSPPRVKQNKKAAEQEEQQTRQHQGELEEENARKLQELTATKAQHASSSGLS